MALRVLIRSGDLESPAAISLDTPRIVIGRGEGSEVRLPDPSVSHRHASIRQRGSDYIVVDEGSTNGTFAGGVRLSPHAPRVVRTGDLLRVGRVWLEIQIDQGPPTPNAQATTREIALLLVQGALAAHGERVCPRLNVRSGPDQGKILELAEFERVYVLGRGPESDLALADGDASRRHLEVARKGEQVRVKDLGSKNGSELGGKRLTANRETAWSRGATLRIGATELSLEDPLSDALAELEAGADEAMRPEEVIEPPKGVTLPPAAPEVVARSQERAAAPLVELPERAPVRERRRGGIGAGDVLVALLALVVLGLSLLGLAWVFRAD